MKMSESEHEREEIIRSGLERHVWVRVMEVGTMEWSITEMTDTFPKLRSC